MILNNMPNVATFIAIIGLIAIANTKCINTTDFKYDLKEVSELIGYHSICSEFSKRTCCSANNFDFLAKRMAKIIAGNTGLSNACRFRLTNSLCSFCDGDVGEKIKQGTCPHYCVQFYEDCKHDFFSFDNNNQLKVCKEDDIICSQLEHIIPANRKESICQMLDMKIDQYNCWSGEVSSYFKGAGRSKVKVASKPQTRKKKAKSVWDIILEQKHIIVPITLVLIILVLYFMKKAQARHANWKRQIRNL